MRQWARPVLILALLVAGVAAARALGLGDLVRLENVGSGEAASRVIS